jgi:hypothetical protein
MTEKESNKVLNIVLLIAVLSYFMSTINALVAVNYETLIKHYYIMGLTLVYIMFPAYIFKYYIVDKIKIKTNDELEKESLWKKEINNIITPIIYFIQNSLGYFIILIVVSHIITYLKIDYLLIKALTNIGLDLSKGFSIWFLMLPLMLLIWGFSTYLLFFSKGKFKKIFPKKIFLFTFFMSTITFAYNVNFFISANIHTEIFVKLYKGVVETDTKIVPCEKNEIICVKISVEELEKNKKEFMPQDDSFPEVKASAEFIINRFINRIKNSNEMTHIYYFTSEPSFRYNDEWFSPIIAYNKETQMLLVDNNTAPKVIQKERHNKFALIGVSTMIWIGIIMLLEIFHEIFLAWRRRKIKKIITPLKEIESGNKL